MLQIMNFCHLCRYASSESVWEKRYYADMSKLLVQWKADLELRDGHDQVRICMLCGQFAREDGVPL